MYHAAVLLWEMVAVLPADEHELTVSDKFHKIHDLIPAVLQ